MKEDQVLDKTNRINLLIDFYEPLLTEKQRTFLKYYYHDDYSLSEIAAQFEVSRQAVYEHIKRAGVILEEYEHKLKLLNKHEARISILRILETEVMKLENVDTDPILSLITQIQSID